MVSGKSWKNMLCYILCSFLLHVVSESVFGGGFGAPNTSEGIWITERTNVADWDAVFSRQCSGVYGEHDMK